MKNINETHYDEEARIIGVEDVTVSELINILSTIPPESKVRVASSSATYSDEIAIYYDGAHVNLSGE